MKTHKDLDVWNISIRFVTEIYSNTMKFPKSQRYGLSSQLERAACSIPYNIAEGYAREGNREKIRFLYFALGSNTEVETQLIIARNLNLIQDSTYQQLSEQNEYIGRMLTKLIRYFKSKV